MPTNANGSDRVKECWSDVGDGSRRRRQKRHGGLPLSPRALPPPSMPPLRKRTRKHPAHPCKHATRFKRREITGKCQDELRVGCILPGTDPRVTKVRQRSDDGYLHGLSRRWALETASIVKMLSNDATRRRHLFSGTPSCRGHSKALCPESGPTMPALPKITDLVC
jgi:hypothetical protein